MDGIEFKSQILATFYGIAADLTGTIQQKIESIQTNRIDQRCASWVLSTDARFT